jgi:thiamine biosynthesis lipoprotein
MIQQSWLQMGMPITVRIDDDTAGEADIAAVWEWFDQVDQRYSPYRETSEVSRLNAGALDPAGISPEFAEILLGCALTKAETGGWFDARRGGRLDPSGLVKGWAIQRASTLLTARGHRHHFVDAGGDAQASGRRGDGQPWRVGIRNPFNHREIVNVLAVSDRGVATSGTAARGQHIDDPWRGAPAESDLVSLTVVGPSIYDADRLATAAFAMGRAGLAFIAEQPEFAAYAITADGIALSTSEFADYVR